MDRPDAARPAYRDRLTFDPEISDDGPIIKGTWVTAREIVDHVVDGFSWDEILRMHSEVEQEDVAACMEFALAEVNGET